VGTGKLRLSLTRLIDRRGELLTVDGEGGMRRKEIFIYFIDVQPLLNQISTTTHFLYNMMGQGSKLHGWIFSQG
jgi:hypothetical protein